MKVTLRDWANNTFKKPPHDNTVRNWIMKGYIDPPPIRIGREWYFEEQAKINPMTYFKRRQS